MVIDYNIAQKRSAISSRRSMSDGYCNFIKVGGKQVQTPRLAHSDNEKHEM